MRGAEVLLTSLLTAGTLVLLVLLVPVALALGAWAGFMVMTRLWP
jgi:hypothetical protein